MNEEISICSKRESTG